jgi:predicted O-linked N-acetylglucosamine transferase (SPINDLY family)
MLRSLYEQTAALTLRDVARVERIQPELEKLLGRLQELDQRAVQAAKALAGELGAAPHLRSVVDHLEKGEGRQLQALANRVKVAAQHVEEVIDKNRQLIESELEYISGTMALIAKTASEQQGPFAVIKPGPVVLDKVA